MSLCFEGWGEESGAIDCLISLAPPPPSLVAIYRKCLFWTPSNVFTACTNASGGGGREGGMANTPDKRALLLLPSLFLLSLHGGGGKGIKRVTLSFSSTLLLFLLVILEKWKVFANPFFRKIFFVTFPMGRESRGKLRL